jgi:hypothetical protein
MLNIFTINNSGFPHHYLSNPLHYLRNQVSTWYPTINFQLHRYNKKQHRFDTVYKIGTNFIHRSGHIILAAQGYDDMILQHLQNIAIWFERFDKYVIVTGENTNQSANDIAEKYNSIGFKSLIMIDKINEQFKKFEQTLKQRPIVLGENENNHFGLDLIGNFAVNNKKFSTYTHPLQEEKHLKNYIASAMKYLDEGDIRYLHKRKRT